MRTTFVLFGMLTVSILVSAVQAEDAQVPAPEQKDPVICKVQVVTGSLLPGPRICRTKSEWDELTRQDQQDFERTQNNGSVNTTAMPGG